MVNALMPLAHSAWGRLCRTSAVVEATTDKNTPPNNSPDASTTGQADVSAGSSVATPNKAFSRANASPPRLRSSRPAHTRDEATTARPSSA